MPLFYSASTQESESHFNVMSLSHEAITYIIHHVVLPPQLPDKWDDDHSHEQDLLEVVIASLEDLRESCGEEHLKTVGFAISTITHLVQCREDSGHISQARLKKALADLSNGLGAMVPLQVQEQNAGILISRCDDGIVFEYFELSPTNEAAMGQGRLVRAFPAFASKIPACLARDKHLQDAIAATITTLSTEEAPHFQPTSCSRSPSPGLVTDFLMNVTTALGETVDVSRIVKNTREDVITGGRAPPWRRSSMWLLIRVTLHLLFSRRGVDEQYKAFMVLLLSRIIDLVRHTLFTLRGRPFRAKFPYLMSLYLGCN